MPITKDMRYSWRNTGSDCQFGDPFLGSRGSGVHADRKYRFKWLFFENNRFNQDLNLQFSGLRLVAFLPHSLGGGGCERLPEARYCPPIRSRWRIVGFGRVCPGFLVAIRQYYRNTYHTPDNDRTPIRHTAAGTEKKAIFEDPV